MCRALSKRKETRLIKRPTKTMTPNKDLLVITASNGKNLELAKRFINSATEIGATPDLLDLRAMCFLYKI